MAVNEADIFSGIWGATFGAIIGTLLAFILTRYSLQKKEKQELEKLHRLINDEFYRIHIYANKTIESLKSLLEDPIEFRELIWNTMHEASRGRDPVLINVPNFRFLLWESIVSSGKLILLKAEEIQLINSTHDNMEHTFHSIDYEFQQFDKTVRLSPENQKELSYEELKVRTHVLIAIVYSSLHRIKYDYESLKDKIKWFKNEFSSAHLQDINEGLDDSPVDILSMIPFPQEPEPPRKTPV